VRRPSAARRSRALDVAGAWRGAVSRAAISATAPPDPRRRPRDRDGRRRAARHAVPPRSLGVRHIRCTGMTLMHAHPSAPPATRPQPIIRSEETRCSQCHELISPKGDDRASDDRTMLCVDCAYEFPCTD
jgi:hypothetical protein